MRARGLVAVLLGESDVAGVRDGPLVGGDAVLGGRGLGASDGVLDADIARGGRMDAAQIETAASSWLGIRIGSGGLVRGERRGRPLLVLAGGERSGIGRWPCSRCGSN